MPQNKVNMIKDQVKKSAEQFQVSNKAMANFRQTCKVGGLALGKHTLSKRSWYKKMV